MTVCMYVCMCTCIHSTCINVSEQFENSKTCRIFEAWAKLAQKWLVCAPLGITVNAVSDNIHVIIINCATGSSKRELAVPHKKLFGPMVQYIHVSLSKTLMYMYMYMYNYITLINYTSL